MPYPYTMTESSNFVPKIIRGVFVPSKINKNITYCKMHKMFIRMIVLDISNQKTTTFGVILGQISLVKNRKTTGGPPLLGSPLVRIPLDQILVL